jgi:hypothetical protein
MKNNEDNKIKKLVVLAARELLSKHGSISILDLKFKVQSLDLSIKEIKEIVESEMGYKFKTGYESFPILYVDEPLDQINHKRKKLSDLKTTILKKKKEEDIVTNIHRSYKKKDGKIITPIDKTKVKRGCWRISSPLTNIVLFFDNNIVTKDEARYAYYKICEIPLYSPYSAIKV